MNKMPMPHKTALQGGACLLTAGAGTCLLTGTYTLLPWLLILLLAVTVQWQYAYIRCLEAQNALLDDVRKSHQPPCHVRLAIGGHDVISRPEELGTFPPRV